MARRRVRRLRLVRAALLLQIVAAAVVATWYLLQPPARQEEVRFLLGNALEREKRIDVVDVARDLWSLYYGRDAVAVASPPGREIVYGGVPRPTSVFPGGVKVLPNTGFAVGYAESLRTPVWAAYRVFDLDRLPETPPRPDGFAVDVRTVARIEPGDFTGSGYDRGHLAPNFAIATRFGVEAQRQTFLMSNVVPQRPALNSGPWRALEMRIATSYPGRFREVWVIAGPIFGAQPARLAGRVPVPEACFMIVLDEREGGLRAMALRLPQAAGRDYRLKDGLTSIDAVEAETGLDLLWELEDRAEATLEAQISARIW